MYSLFISAAIQATNPELAKIINDKGFILEKDVEKSKIDPTGGKGVPFVKQDKNIDVGPIT